jgi:hypothetical protein
MNSILSINYATLSRKFRDRRAATNLPRWGKSQTVSGQSRKVLFAAWPMLRKVGTLFPLFTALPLAEILSTPSIELLDSKIQTPSGKFCGSRLRNLDLIATMGGAS